MANRFNFDKVLAKWQATDISLGVANVAKNDFLNNFREQGFNGNKWEERKKNKDSGRAILIGKGSGRLRKDVSNSVTTGHKNNNLSYTLIVKNPYAGYLNDGTDRMVQRQFVGTTPELRRKILLKIDQLTRRIWANL